MEIAATLAFSGMQRNLSKKQIPLRRLIPYKPANSNQTTEFVWAGTKRKRTMKFDPVGTFRSVLAIAFESAFNGRMRERRAPLVQTFLWSSHQSRSEWKS